MKIITAYVTNDGIIHTEKEKAESHILDYVCQVLEKQVSTPLLDSGRFTKSDIFKIITSTFPDYKTACDLISEMHSMTKIRG